jgi:hypothetical protein
MSLSFRSLLFSALGLTALSAPAAAQDAKPLPGSVAQALADWNTRTGREWRLTAAPELNGMGKFLWGAQAEAAFTPQDDADWFELTRQAFDAAYGIFHIADSTLQPVEVQFLNLSQIGSTDKVSVEMTQVVRGVSVRGGSVHALFTPMGALLALDSNGLPGVEGLAVSPVANRWEAVTHARNHFAAAEGMSALTTGEPELLIVRDASGEIVQPRLAWSIELRNEANPSDPAGLRVYVAADDTTGAIVAVDQLIHHQQIQGHVDSWATPGTRAHSAANPPALHLMPFMNLTSSAGNVTTNASGDFTFNSANPVTFTARYIGPYCRVENQAGANHSTSLSFTPGVPATLTMNQAQTEFATSEASCYDSVLDARAWLKSINPNDTKFDFQVFANANINSSCNAYYNGSSINMYRASGGCNNTGFSTVVVHEEGHWANDLYGSGNGGDGFGEGNADVLAMYVYDTPIVGQDFFANGGFVRTGENMRQFCGNGNGGCYGEVHNDGEVLMGALWKVRVALNASLGNAAGDLTANTLWVAWMNAYNDTQIRTVVEDHWLALDDNDANLLNGTPNYSDINEGFVIQGFPGVDIDTISVVHTPLGNSLSEVGPYVAVANMTSIVGSTVTSGEVVYQVDNGAAGSAAMTHVGGTKWAGAIPGQPSPATVRYHLVGHDALGNDERYPEAGELEFVVGTRTQIYFNDFEGVTDEGWTHGKTRGTDDWQRGTPMGSSTDPNVAYSGLKVWGNDVATGLYANNSTNFLTSPTFDCSGLSGVTLRFARFLGIAGTNGHSARIEVNGSVIWSSPGGGLVDGQWTLLEYDISAIADNQPAVVVKFFLESGVLGGSGGWNVDDFELFTMDAAPPGLDAITLSGPTLVSAGTQRNWSFSGGPANAPFWLLNGASADGLLRQGHAFNVGAPVMLLDSGTTSGGGAGAVTLQIPQAAAGRTAYFEIAARAGGAWHDSNLLTVFVQ